MFKNKQGFKHFKYNIVFSILQIMQYVVLERTCIK